MTPRGTHLQLQRNDWGCICLCTQTGPCWQNCRGGRKRFTNIITLRVCSATAASWLLTSQHQIVFFAYLNKVTKAATLQLHLHPYLKKPRIAALWAERWFTQKADSRVAIIIPTQPNVKVSFNDLSKMFPNMQTWMQISLTTASTRLV